MKTPIELIPLDAIDEIAKTAILGVEKHGKFKYKDGQEFSKVYGSLMRHLREWYYDGTMDEESGLDAIYHAAFRILQLSTYAKDLNKYGEFDDRPCNK